MNPTTMPARNNLKKSRSIRNPNAYVTALIEKLNPFSIDEEAAVDFKGQWREKAFGATAGKPLDLEIGTGVGYYFVHHAKTNPDRLLVGLEVKFKSLHQTVERVHRAGMSNARGVRYNGQFVEDLFAENELDKVIIHHPDPWSKRSQSRRRMVQTSFLEKLSRLQKPGAILDLKTDSDEYYYWALKEIEKSPYSIQFHTADLHQSEMAEENFVTQFERIFLDKGQPIYFARMINS